MQNCRICNADKSRQSIRAEHVYGGKKEHKFWHCSNCDATYLSPVPSKEEETRFYKMEFENFMQDRSGKDRNWSTAEAHITSNQDQVKRRWGFLKPYLEENLSLLEIGCSSGFMLDAFTDAGLRCTAVEPSGEFTEFLKMKGYSVYDSLESLMKQQSSVKFDLITHFFLFEHIRDPYSFLKSTLDLLNPKGVMIAEIPCINDPLVSLYSIPDFEKFYWSIAHHYYYSPKSLTYILDKLDLQYELIPEQRYDLSNHLSWAIKGKPGGQGKFNHIFSDQLRAAYKEDLVSKWICDTIFLIIKKPPNK
jgi:SAM-dependent methyltransferase